MDDVNFVPIKKEDLELIRIWRNSPEVGKYMYTEDKISTEQQILWFEKINKEETSRYWIIEYQKRKLGLVSLTNIDFRNGKCFWGFYLGDSSVRGKGIGVKIEFKLIEYVFEELKLNKLYGEVFSFNEKVIQMHEKFGFRREGYFRQHIKKSDRFWDVVSIGLLKTEWDQIKSSLRKKYIHN